MKYPRHCVRLLLVLTLWISRVVYAEGAGPGRNPTTRAYQYDDPSDAERSYDDGDHYYDQLSHFVTVRTQSHRSIASFPNTDVFDA